MGPLTFPLTGLVGLDSVTLIYAVEKKPNYRLLIDPLWTAAKRGELTLLLSELAISEALVMPLRNQDAKLIRAYEAVVEAPGFRVEPVTWEVLKEASRLRAEHPSLRTPDAIHLSTAELARCDVFVTNDKALRYFGTLPVIVLDDHLATS